MKIFKLLLVAMLCISLFAVDRYFAANEEKKEKPEKDPKNYLVVLKDKVDRESFIQNKKLKDKKLKDKHPKKFKHINSFAISLTENEVDELKKDAEVRILEEDGKVAVTADTSPSVEQDIPWGISKIGSQEGFKQNIYGQAIKVAVLDTGIANHPDLAVKDGVSLVNGTDSFIDDNGHGTHVAGTISALNNQFGVVGAAPSAEIYAIKVLNSSGEGSYSQVIQGIEWAIDHQINILSMSIGGMTPSLALHEVIKQANDKGILLIASAGNFGMGEETEAYPARFTEVLSIGAVDHTNTRASFSSTGSELDMVAPGVNIYSTTSDGDYGYKSGTSMAAPHVAGAAAAIWSNTPTLTNEQVKQKLVESATPLGAKNEYGHGMVNVAKALGLELPVDPEKPNLPKNEPNSNLRNFESSLSQLVKILSYLKEKAEESKEMELRNQLEEDSNYLVIEYQKLFSERFKLNEVCYSEVDLKNIEVSKEAYFKERQVAFHKLEQFYQKQIDQYLQKLGLTMDGINEEMKPLSETVLENNQSIDVYLGRGASQVYTFTPTVTTIYTIFTDSYSGVGGLNDTVLEIFADSELSNQIAYNDNYECTIFSKVNITLTAGTTYYIKLSPATKLDWVFARLSITSKVQTLNLQLNEPHDVNVSESSSQTYEFIAPEDGSYQIATTYYENNPDEGENNTVLYVYSDSGLTNQIGFNNNANGTTFSTVELNLRKDTKIYIKLAGILSSAVHARIYVSKNAFLPGVLSINAPINVNIEEGKSMIFSFTPSESEIYRIFTDASGGAGELSDTYLKLFEDEPLTKLLAENDDSSNAPFSSIQYQFKAGQTYYILLNGFARQAIAARLTISPGSQYVYDAAGRLDYIIMSDGKKLDFQYDLNGNLVKKVLVKQ